MALANLPGGSRPQMLTAKSVRAQLALLPLLSGNAVISALTVEQPDLLLERTADGTPNWQFVAERRALYAGHGGSGGGGNHRVQIQALTLHGGQVRWRPVHGEAETLGIGKLLVSAESTDLPMTLAFEGTRGDVPVTASASSGSLQRLQGGPVSALAGTWPLTIDVAAQGATVHLTGGINHPDQGRGYSFRVTVVAPSLDALGALVPGYHLPPLSEVNATGLLQDGSTGELRTSQVSLHAGASDLSAWAPGLSLKQATLSAPGPGQLIQLNVDGTYQDQPLRVAANTMQPDVVGNGGGPMQLLLSAQAAGATLQARGSIPPRWGASGLDMTVSLRAPDLSALSPLAGHTLPAAQNLTLDAKLGDAGVKLRGIVLRDLAITSSLGDATGELTMDWSPRVTINGTLTSRMLNLDGLAPDAASSGLPAIWPPPAGGGQVAIPAPTPAAPPAGLAPSKAAAAPPNALPLDRLRNTDADLNLSVAQLVFGAKHYADLQAHLQLAGGKLALNPFRVQSPEGLVVGGASIDASSDQPPIAVTLRSPSISADAVAATLGYPGGATGTMQVDAQLSGVGQTAQAIEATLDGHLGLAMVGGQVEDSLVEGLVGTALDTAGVRSFGGGSSQVRCFALRVDFRHGQGTVRALAADTSRLALDGDGQLDLAAGTAALHLRPRVRLGPTEIAAPVSLTGPFGQLKASLDPVLGGGRYGLTIGGAPSGSTCPAKLALARGGLGGPMPAVVPQQPGFNLNNIHKPKDLLQGLFH